MAASFGIFALFASVACASDSCTEYHGQEEQPAQGIAMIQMSVNAVAKTDLKRDPCGADTKFSNFGSNSKGCPQLLQNVCLDERGSDCKVYIDVPEQCAGNAGKACAAVVAFHGSGGTAASWANDNSVGMYLHDGDSLMFGIYPQGADERRTGVKSFGPSQPEGGTWNTQGIVSGVDEEAFISKILESLKTAGWTGRYYALGHSNGAAMVQLFAVNNAIGFSGAFAAATQLTKEPEALSRPSGWSTHPSSSTKPIPIMTWHGTQDEYIQYEGGPLLVNDSVVLYSEDESNELWAKNNGCSSGAKKTNSTTVDTPAASGGWVMEVYTFDCPTTSPVIHYKVVNGDHMSWESSDGIPIALQFLDDIEKGGRRSM